MKFSDRAELLDPDYSKSTVEVYQDYVEMAFVNFQNTDVLLCITGNENPSWIPHWDWPMLFWNLFQFGKALPWKPAGETKPIWNIDKTLNVLSLSGFVVDHIKFVEFYSKSFFSNTMTKSDEGRNALKQVWQRILKAVKNNQSRIFFGISVLTAAATSFSFGLNKKANPADEHHLFHNFIAYLKNCAWWRNIQQVHTARYVWGVQTRRWTMYSVNPSEISNILKLASSSQKVGWLDALYLQADQETWSVSHLEATYSFILWLDGDHFLIRGFAYVHGIMHGEQHNSEEQVFKIH